MRFFVWKLSTDDIEEITGKRKKFISEDEFLAVFKPTYEVFCGAIFLEDRHGNKYGFDPRTFKYLGVIESKGIVKGKDLLNRVWAPMKEFVLNNSLKVNEAIEMTV